MRTRVTTRPGYPCRISLQDAEVGEEVLLLTFRHQAVASPYAASGPIYIRRSATQSFDAVNVKITHEQNSVGIECRR